MPSAKKSVKPESVEFADWYPKMVAARGTGGGWFDDMTPAERRQFDAEQKWASRAFREDLPGPGDAA